MTKDVLLSIKGLQIGENERGGHGRSERIDQEHD